MLKSDEMKVRSCPHIGVFLVSYLSPLPLIEQSEPAKISMVDDPLKNPDWAKMCATVEMHSDVFYVENTQHLFDVKPISWFIQNKVPLCSVSTVPYEQGRVHKPPWEI